MPTTVTATVEGTNNPPRVRLNVTNSGTPALSLVNVTRTVGGVSTPVRTLTGGPMQLSEAGGQRVGVLYDVEMPYGQAATYSTVEDPTQTSAAVTVNETRVWLIHPGVPARSMPVRVFDIAKRSRQVNRGVYAPMGRRSLVVQTDGRRKAPSYNLVVRTGTLAELQTVIDLIDDAGVLLLNVPVSKGWGVTTEYVSIGDVDEDRIARWGALQDRDWTFPCQVVDAPAGGAQPQRTYLDLLQFPSYAALQAAYPSYQAVLTGP